MSDFASALPRTQNLYKDEWVSMENWIPRFITSILGRPCCHFLYEFLYIKVNDSEPCAHITPYPGSQTHIFHVGWKYNPDRLRDLFRQAFFPDSERILLEIENVKYEADARRAAVIYCGFLIKNGGWLKTSIYYCARFLLQRISDHPLRIFNFGIETK